jgi:hypothetical protein
MLYYHFPRKVLVKVPNFVFPFVKPLELLARLLLLIFCSLRKGRECKAKKKMDLKD